MYRTLAGYSTLARIATSSFNGVERLDIFTNHCIILVLSYPASGKIYATQLPWNRLSCSRFALCGTGGISVSCCLYVLLISSDLTGHIHFTTTFVSLPFKSCVVMDGKLQGSCVNSHFGSPGGGCNFHHDLFSSLLINLLFCFAAFFGSRPFCLPYIALHARRSVLVPYSMVSTNGELRLGIY